jgi:hypothetical protein
MWFKNKWDEGAIHQEFSDNGIPLPSIALILTAICVLFNHNTIITNDSLMQVECVIDEWQTGKHVDVPFSVAGYHSKYDAHIKTLNEFNNHTKEANIVPRLCQQLLKRARCVILYSDWKTWVYDGG